MNGDLGSGLFEFAEHRDDDGTADEVVADPGANEAVAQLEGSQLPHPEVAEPLHRMRIEAVLRHASEELLLPTAADPARVVHVGGEGEFWTLPATAVSGEKIAEGVLLHRDMGKAVQEPAQDPGDVVFVKRCRRGREDGPEQGDEGGVFHGKDRLQVRCPLSVVR